MSVLARSIFAGSILAGGVVFRTAVVFDSRRLPPDVDISVPEDRRACANPRAVQHPLVGDSLGACAPGTATAQHRSLRPSPAGVPGTATAPPVSLVRRWRTRDRTATVPLPRPDHPDPPDGRRGRTRDHSVAPPGCRRTDGAPRPPTVTVTERPEVGSCGANAVSFGFDRSHDDSPARRRGERSCRSRRCSRGRFPALAMEFPAFARGLVNSMSLYEYTPSRSAPGRPRERGHGRTDRSSPPPTTRPDRRPLPPE